MTCDPENSLFLETIKNGTTSDGRTYVDEINYYVSNDYAHGLFDSCNEVELPVLNIPAINTLCGTVGKLGTCTPLSLLENLGLGSQTPFYIHFYIIDTTEATAAPNGIKPMDVKTKLCDETCSCQVSGI